MSESDGVTVRVFEGTDEFFNSARDFLAQDPISTNVIVTVTAGLAASDQAPGSGTVWAVTETDGSVTGAAILNLPWNLFISHMAPEAATLVADRFDEVAENIPGVTGASDATMAFADRWADLRGVAVRLVGHRQVYLLHQLVWPPRVQGQARLFRDDEVPLVAEWLEAFHAEAVPDDPAMDTIPMATERIAHRELWAWSINDTPVALVASAPTPNGVARIGPVYTPPTKRGFGYAGNATATAVQAAFDGGASAVMLYADVENATSNALYQRLGFQPDHLATQISFE